jgi:hypothetical protein
MIQCHAIGQSAYYELKKICFLLSCLLLGQLPLYILKTKNVMGDNSKTDLTSNVPIIYDVLLYGVTIRLNCQQFGLNSKKGLKYTL